MRVESKKAPGDLDSSVGSEGGLTNPPSPVMLCSTRGGREAEMAELSSNLETESNGGS